MRPLSDIQARILALIATGKTNREVAVALGLTEAAVKLHTKAVFRRIKVRNRTQATIVFLSGAPLPDAASRTLSGRQFDVLELLSEGKSMKEIGVALGLSWRTVDTHLAAIYEKLDVDNRAAAAQAYRSMRAA